MPDARFLTLAQVTDELNISLAQATAQVHRGELRAFKLGGRGQWRIGRDDLEAYIQRCYQETAQAVKAASLRDVVIEETG